VGERNKVWNGDERHVGYLLNQHNILLFNISLLCTFTQPVEYRWVDGQTDRQDRPACPPGRWTANREIDFQTDRRTARQTDGMSGRHMDCQDTQTARQTRTVRQTDGLPEDCQSDARTAGQEAGQWTTT
jgi:hypothetical protein